MVRTSGLFTILLASTTTLPAANSASRMAAGLPSPDRRMASIRMLMAS